MNSSAALKAHVRPMVRKPNGAHIQHQQQPVEPEKIFNSSYEMFNMLETCPSNIMYCGLDLIIKYMNPASRSTLLSIEHVLPVPVDQIIGTSIDVFHANPQHQRRLLSSDRNLPVKSSIQVGEEHMELSVSAIYDSANQYSGVLVTWDLVTEKRKIEAEAARLKSIVENVNINIMCADKSGVIEYLNPESIKTLKTIEKDLPVRVDQIKGQQFDIFHKVPSGPRRIIADERNLPHKAVIDVGANKLALNVSPMRDAKGQYIGPMVTWWVITEKIMLVQTLEETSAQLGAAAEELSATATQMSKNSQKTSDQSQSAAAAAEQVSAGVQTVATNTEEMAASIKDIAKSSSEAASISKETLQRATDTNVMMNQLGASSQEIGNVIKVISSIAQQTNLLALNATIEAARAGEAGKGFAVVANEVKELAKQTAKATEDITNRIGAIQADSKKSVEAIGGIASVIEKLNGISMAIAAAVEEQTATTNEVSRVVQESSTGVGSIAETIKVVAEAAQQSSAGAGQTLASAQSLSDLAVKLKDLVKKIEV